MQRCQSGRMCTLGKRVYGNVPRVQIPPAAPIKLAGLFKPAFLFFNFHVRDLHPTGINSCRSQTAHKVLPALAKNLPQATFINASPLLLRQSELRLITQFFFCLKGVPAIIIPTIKFVPKQSLHYLNLKRDKHRNWIK